MNLFIIDGIAPFFRGYERDVINWSKTPFEHIEKNGLIDPGKSDQIKKDFRTFCQRASEAGYNAITLDDLAHLCVFPFYSPALQIKVLSYRKLFGELFQIADCHGLQVYITTDLMFFNDDIEEHVARNPDKMRAFAAASCQQLLETFSKIAGIIVRVGESDGLDVEGDFCSRLTIKNPVQARKMLRALLPVFERLNRQLIFRTWSVGIGRVGDIIWNPRTFDRVFNGLESDNLIISIKHGQSDFFRYLPLNQLFLRGKHRKLVEFQARREYEGFGEYPSFVGWDHEKIKTQLEGQNVVGISVWAQTGGWSGFRRLTWLDNNALWNEINAFVTVRMFRKNISTDEAIREYAESHLNGANWKLLKELLALSDEVIKELLYIEEFASNHLFFRRLKVPPLITVYWWHIVANHFMRKVMKHFVKDKERSVKQGYDALHKIKRMQKLARQLELQHEDIEFQYDTFEIIAVVREYFFMPFDPEIIGRLENLKSSYEQKHPEQRYRIALDFSKIELKSAHLALMLKLFFRKQQNYRMFDRIVTLYLLSFIYPIIKRCSRKMLPDFAQQSAMGIESVLK